MHKNATDQTRITDYGFVFDLSVLDPSCFLFRCVAKDKKQQPLLDLGNIKHYVAQNTIQSECSQKPVVIFSIGETVLTEQTNISKILSILVQSLQLQAVYTVYNQERLRLVAKLALGFDPFLPIYIAESIEEAHAAILAPYVQINDLNIKRDEILHSAQHAKFYELWETTHSIRVWAGLKYRVLAYKDWTHISVAGDFSCHITVIEGKILYLRLAGKVGRDFIKGIKAVLDRLFAELDSAFLRYYYIFDLAALDTSLRSNFALYTSSDFYKLLQPIHFSIIAASSITRSIVALQAKISKTNRPRLSKYATLTDVFSNLSHILEHTRFHELPLYQQHSTKSNKQLAFENWIHQHNIELGREKMLLTINNINWQEHKILMPEYGHLVTYNDIFEVLDIVRLRIDATWNKQQTKNWQLQMLKEKGLRSQFDPHFIFNLLNAFRPLIADNNQELLQELLNDFSDLIRMLIENSLMDQVSLATEIAFLRLYVKLESYRYEGYFDAVFEIQPTVASRIEEISLPPFIIWPYLEQAIWERILPANTFCKLHIQFSIYNDSLECSITDDGLGFDANKSSSLANIRQPKMEAHHNRLQLLDEIQEFKIKIFRVETTKQQTERPNTKLIIRIQQECL
ncbi:MAG: hypothetical protein RIS47_618 [Bacteroidota bacterium]